MSDVNSNQMVDEIIEAVDNARENECPQQVRKGIIDSLYWINAYQLIERYKDDLMSMNVVDDYIDCSGSDWVGEVIAFESMLKRFQRKAIKVAINGRYGTSLTGGAEINEGNSITYSPSGSWALVANGQIGVVNADQSGNTITVNGGVGSHRLNGNGVLEVNTVDGWVTVESNTISIGYRCQDSDSDDRDLMFFTMVAL